MNLYHCMIDLKEEAKALGFAKAVDDWMGHLQQAGMIRSWRLMRRKLNLAAEGHRDFLLEIEVEDISQLDRAFRFSGGKDDEIERMYRAVHEHIGQSAIGLYRPFPDPERAERMGLI